MTLDVPAGTDAATGGELVDQRTLALLHEYARLTKTELTRVNEHLLRLVLPEAEAQYFDGRREHLLALDVSGVERFPDAELPVIGGVFWTGLVAAVRARGARRAEGALPVTVTAAATTPAVQIVDAESQLESQTQEVRRVVRLASRLTLSAGTTVHEEVVESDPIDLTTGHELDPSIAALLDLPADGADAGLPRADETKVDRLVPAIVRGLEERVASRIQTMQRESDRSLTQELARLHRYYDALKQELRAETGSDSAAVRAVEQEEARRRGEEERRHRVRVNVEPLQVLERAVVAERVTWRLTTPAGRTARLHAQRYLTGTGDWNLRCECCATTPAALTVCRFEHAVGTECTSVCSVCNERYCTAHGHAGCAIDHAPVCLADADTCYSCDRTYCVRHQARCAEGDHAVCVECARACSVCGRGACLAHGTLTDPASLRGERFVCTDCVVYCEGSTREAIGRDEAALCGTCGASICERHQMQCVVDLKPHCSRHLQRTDRSRRFICAAHVAACDREPGAMFAADEVHACTECGATSCVNHGAACYQDRTWYCREHLVALMDVQNALACATHRTVCHVDGRSFSPQGTTPCEICARPTCRMHLRACRWCGASACDPDRVGDRCVTCTRLAPEPNIPDEVVAAAATITGEQKVKQWLLARDAGRFVVQLELGWLRRLVFSVPHGTATAVRAVRHSPFGSMPLGTSNTG